MKTADNKDHDKSSKSSVRRTPRQLIKHHIEHPEESITDQDIEELIIGSAAVSLNLLRRKQVMERKELSFSDN